jgi:Mlc titration factor MtfA (ptsG expression regulator)
LNLGHDAYDDWQEIIIYPSQFRTTTRFVDHIGVVHESENVLAGQARSDGPVIFSWHDVMEGPWLDGWNVVIHELAHKLDMRNNGQANGYPILHPGMDHDAWKSAFTDAFAHLQALADANQESPIDLYAATNPAECFAVLSEVFFERPLVLQEVYPAVYEQMSQYYKQNPVERLYPQRYRPVQTHYGHH